MYRCMNTHVRVLLSLNINAQFYYHFNNPAFQTIANTSTCCALETCSHLFGSSEILKCRSLKGLLAHPMKHGSGVQDS